MAHPVLTRLIRLQVVDLFYPMVHSVIRAIRENISHVERRFRRKRDDQCEGDGFRYQLANGLYLLLLVRNISHSTEINSFSYVYFLGCKIAVQDVSSIFIEVCLERFFKSMSQVQF